MQEGDWDCGTAVLESTKMAARCGKLCQSCAKAASANGKRLPCYEAGQDYGYIAVQSKHGVPNITQPNKTAGDMWAGLGWCWCCCCVAAPSLILLLHCTACLLARVRHQRAALSSHACARAAPSKRSPTATESEAKMACTGRALPIGPASQLQQRIVAAQARRPCQS